MTIEKITNAVFGPPPKQVKPADTLEERVKKQEDELKALKERIATLEAAIKLLVR